LAFAGTGNQNSRQTVFTAAVNECNHPSVNPPGSPVAELEISRHITVNGGNQNFQTSISHAVIAVIGPHSYLGKNNGQAHNISLKKYLSHIYPSHNFW
jgi:hypothetical protein